MRVRACRGTFASSRIAGCTPGSSKRVRTWASMPYSRRRSSRSGVCNAAPLAMAAAPLALSLPMKRVIVTCFGTPIRRTSAAEIAGSVDSPGITTTFRFRAKASSCSSSMRSKNQRSSSAMSSQCAPAPATARTMRRSSCWNGPAAQRNANAPSAARATASTSLRSSVSRVVAITSYALASSCTNSEPNTPRAPATMTRFFAATDPPRRSTE